MMNIFATPTRANEIETTPMISFDQVDGIHTDSVLNLSGNSSVPLTSIEIVLWNISNPDQWDLITSNPFLDTVVPYTDIETDSTMWAWEHSFDTIAFDCTCYVEISLLDQTDLVSFGIVIYVGDERHRPVLQHAPESENFHSAQIFNDRIIDLSYDYLLPPSQSESTSIAGTILTNVRICPAPYGICVDNYESILASNTSFSSTFELEIDANMESLLDGFYILQVQIQDVYLALSNNITQYIVLDQTKPNVHLSAVNQVNEAQSIVVDINVDDGYVGSSYSITWSITEPDGNPRAVLNSEILNDSRLEFEPTKAGDYRVNALVRDLGGHLIIVYHNVTVDNLPPTAQVRFDGFLVQDGSTITVPSSGDWIFSANTSSDTSNDQNTLDFYWFVDGKTLLSGKSYLSSSDIQSSNYKQIRVQVVDNDGEVDELAFDVVQQGEETQDNSSNSILASTVSLLFILAVGIVVYLRQRKQSDSTTGFVKWTERGEEPKN
ncbi:MAG: hypothetical protein ACO3MI_01125 [Candidatus Poseidoniaceae archaeon]